MEIKKLNLKLGFLILQSIDDWIHNHYRLDDFISSLPIIGWLRFQFCQYSFGKESDLE